MSLMVIGISLALPAGLYVSLDNMQRLSAGWGGSAQISVFLKSGVSHTDARSLATQLERRDPITQVQYITPEQALAEFKRHSGFGSALDALPGNPLPGVLVIEPAAGTSAEHLAALVDELNNHKRVDMAQLDMQWVKRLQRILEIAQRGVSLLGLLLAIGVVLTISNTIRLAILNRRQEIEIMKLIGATNAFIRRPFLYSGLFYGLFGAIIAWLLITGGLLALSGPVGQLASLYGSSYALSGLGGLASLLLLATGALLGWTGSRIAVSRHLAEIEPR
ncbi:MAG: ABC transporter permease [Proteobacteria bacterium]|nr:ABC transporter permease [Pseudomonadota bacterium]